MFLATSAMYVVVKDFKIMPRSFQKQLSNQHPNWHRFGSQLGSILVGFWGPRWGHAGTKSFQKSIFKSIKKMFIFLIALGIDFDRFWAPTRECWGGESSPFSDPFSFFLVSWGLLGPRWPQDPSRDKYSPFGRFLRLIVDCFWIDYV